MTAGILLRGRWTCKAPGKVLNHEQQLLPFSSTVFVMLSCPLPWTSLAILEYFVGLSYLFKPSKTSIFSSPMVCFLLIQQVS